MTLRKSSLPKVAATMVLTATAGLMLTGCTASPQPSTTPIIAPAPISQVSAPAASQAPPSASTQAAAASVSLTKFYDGLFNLTSTERQQVGKIGAEASKIKHPTQADVSRLVAELQQADPAFKQLDTRGQTPNQVLLVYGGLLSTISQLSGVTAKVDPTQLTVMGDTAILAPGGLTFYRDGKVIQAADGTTAVSTRAVTMHRYAGIWHVAYTTKTD